MSKLNHDDYARLISFAPVLCVDVILREPEGQYILFRRENEPLKGEWWVVGGRVEKGEKIEDVVRRKLFEEINTFKFSTPNFTGGWYEDFFEFSSVGRGAYHTVSLVFEATVDPKDIRLDGQHSEWKLVDELPLQFKVKK